MVGQTPGTRRERRARSERKWDFWSARERLWSVYEIDTRDVRRDAVSRLDLDAGDAVLDVGCGPGTNFQLLRDAVGPDGVVLGVDLSRGMVRRAADRIESRGWSNVEVVRADVTASAFRSCRFDGALATTSVSATADVRSTVETVYEALEPGASFAVYDIRPVPSGPGRVLNPLVERFYRAVGNWNHREDVLRELEGAFDAVTVVDTFALGTNYVAIAEVAGGRESEGR